MPYADTSELPPGIRDNLPEHAQHIYLEAYNNAWEQYGDAARRRSRLSRESVARMVAWAAVKKKYRKNELTGRWERIGPGTAEKP